MVGEVHLNSMSNFICCTRPGVSMDAHNLSLSGTVFEVLFSSRLD